jgi:aspartate racemase
MKTLGLIGGMSWVSTIDYYKLINEGINQRLGGLNFSQCLIYSFNYADIKRNNDANDWDANFEMVSTAAMHLKNAGASGIILCANTMHLIADRVEKTVDIPVINIAAATALAIQQRNLSRVGLLGTRFTLERDFFTSKLADKGIEAIIPEDEDRGFVHYTIFEELGRNLVKESSKKRFLTIIQQLIDRGAQGMILGCTEIPLLVQQADVAVPIFDTTRIHAAAAVDFALGA